MKKPGISDDMFKYAVKLITRIGHLDDADENDDGPPGTILVFLPGIHEIGQLSNLLTEHKRQ